MRLLDWLVLASLLLVVYDFAQAEYFGGTRHVSEAGDLVLHLLALLVGLIILRVLWLLFTLRPHAHHERER